MSVLHKWSTGYGIKAWEGRLSSVPGFLSYFSIHYVPVCTEKMGRITRPNPNSSTRQFSTILQLARLALVPVIHCPGNRHRINENNTSSHIPWFLGLLHFICSLSKVSGSRWFWTSYIQRDQGVQSSFPWGWGRHGMASRAKGGIGAWWGKICAFGLQKTLLVCRRFWSLDPRSKVWAQFMLGVKDSLKRSFFLYQLWELITFWR